MSDFVSPLLQWLNNNPHLAGLVTFLISAGESVAIIGTIVPGTIMMTGLGALAGAGVIPLWPTIFWAILGAIVGDGISYWLGHYFKDRLTQIWPFRKHPGFLKSGEAFVLKYGAMSVFIGRFVGPVRALVPLVAGMLGMKPLQFTISNIASAILWAPAYMLPGIVLGAASMELPADIAMHVILVLFLMTLFGLLCLWFLYKVIRFFDDRIDQLQSFIWKKFKGSNYFSGFTNLLKYHDSNQAPGQLKLAFYFIISVFLFSIIVINVLNFGPDAILINDISYNFFRGIRRQATDLCILSISIIGQKQLVMPTFFALGVGFAINKRYRAATHILSLAIIAGLVTYFAKIIFHVPRPWGMLQPITTYSLPSGHVVLSTTLVIGIIYFLTLSIASTLYRRLLYAFGISIIFMVGFSRLYLGAHWLTDVLAGWFLSAAIILAIIISFQRSIEAPLKKRLILLYSLPIFIIAYSVFHQHYINDMQISYAQKPKAPSYIALDDWWQDAQGLPSYRTNVFGFPSQAINIAWEGNLIDIQNTLLAQGWQKPPSRDWISTLHRIADVRSNQYLPMISPQYLDKNPELVMAKKSEQDHLMVLRFWDSNLRITKTNLPVWVGLVNIAPRSYSWIYKSHPSQIPITSTTIFSQPENASWDSRLITVTHPRKKNQSLTLLMVKPKNN